MIEKRTNEERKIIYNFIKVIGFDTGTAKTLRDWSDTKILQYLYNKSLNRKNGRTKRNNGK